jgi:hypothetical protein
MHWDCVVWEKRARAHLVGVRLSRSGGASEKTIHAVLHIKMVTATEVIATRTTSCIALFTVRNGAKVSVAKGDNGIGTGVGLRRAPPVAHTVVPCPDSSRGGSRAERGGDQRKEGLATGDALGSTAGEGIKGLLAHGVLLGETQHHNHTRRRLWV